MAVLPMVKINIFGLNRNRKRILEYLQRVGTVEIRETSDDNDEVFSKQDTLSTRLSFENYQKTLQTATNILDNLVPPTGSAFAMFEGRAIIDDSKFDFIENNSAEIVRKATILVNLNKKVEDKQNDILREKTAIETLIPWEKLDVSMRIKETKNTMIFIGSLPGEYDEASIGEMLKEQDLNPDEVQIEIVSSNTMQTCLFVMCHKKICLSVESALRLNGFSYPAIPSKTPPLERIKLLKERISQAEEEVEKLNEEIKSYASDRENFLLAYDYFLARVEKYEVLGKLSKSDNTFYLEGYTLEDKSEQLKKALSYKFGCYVELIKPNEKEEVPVLLKNNPFSSPTEGVVESYSLPKKGEVDPTCVMSIFYYIFFGLMLSDMAYGLIMAIGCAVVLHKFKNMELGMKQNVKMFMYCGISTAIWGLVFGSFFGDVIEVVGETFFNASWSTPRLWFSPIDDPMKLLMYCLGFGIIHIFVGLAMKFYMCVKTGDIKSAIYDVVFWYFLVGGGIIYFMSMQMFADISGMGFTLDPTIGSIGGYMAGIGALGIIATAGRTSKSPAIRIMKGVYGLYNATSYLSDILSYSRLLALGLATGVIASVFNQMGAMAGGGIVGGIVFILVFAAGHSLNIGLNVLGAYVHSNRLEFVEFFSKFYEGGGKKFNPFSAKTKYFKFMEEK